MNDISSEAQGRLQVQKDTKKTALFGGAGFIGSHLVRRLAEAGNYEILVLDVDSSKLKMLVNPASYSYINCDIRQNVDIVERTVAEFDIIVDLVAYANPATYITNPLEIVHLNLFDNLRIVDFCVKHNKRLVQFSSSEVYGKSGGSPVPFHEDKSDCILGPICHHRWIYSCAKQLLERIIHARGIRGELEYTIIRPFNFVGPLIDYLITNHEDGNPRVFSHFMSALLFDGTMKLVDGGIARRSYTYISDAVDAILLILDQPDKTRNEIINIGNPNTETNIRDLAILMKDIYEELTGIPSSTPIVDVSSIDFYGPGYEDCDRRIPNVDKIQAIGWKPKYDLTSTLEMTMRFYVDHYEDLMEMEMPNAYRLLFNGPGLS